MNFWILKCHKNMVVFAAVNTHTFPFTLLSKKQWKLRSSGVRTFSVNRLFYLDVSMVAVGMLTWNYQILYVQNSAGIFVVFLLKHYLLLVTVAYAFYPQDKLYR